MSKDIALHIWHTFLKFYIVDWVFICSRRRWHCQSSWLRESIQSSCGKLSCTFFPFNSQHTLVSMLPIIWHGWRCQAVQLFTSDSCTNHHISKRTTQIMISVWYEHQLLFYWYEFFWIMANLLYKNLHFYSCIVVCIYYYHHDTVWFFSILGWLGCVCLDDCANLSVPILPLAPEPQQIPTEIKAKLK